MSSLHHLSASSVLTFPNINWWTGLRADSASLATVAKSVATLFDSYGERFICKQLEHGKILSTMTSHSSDFFFNFFYFFFCQFSKFFFKIFFNILTENKNIALFASLQSNPVNILKCWSFELHVGCLLDWKEGPLLFGERNRRKDLCILSCRTLIRYPLMSAESEKIPIIRKIWFPDYWGFPVPFDWNRHRIWILQFQKTS